VARRSAITPDYDEALAFYTGKLDFELLEEQHVPG
jgi:catechol 2,3-dioxygenase-like lactoylglutathione lyase family enzyme